MDLDFADIYSLEDAAKYESAFAYIEEKVFPIRGKNPRQTNTRWWQYERPRVDMRKALAGISRFICTPAVSKFRVFVWRGPEFLCNQSTLVYARSDDYFFGVLHSRLHEVWALKLGTRLETRPRYTPTTSFETFPFPIPSTVQATAIATAAKELDDLRTTWLNPPEWTHEELLEFPGSISGPWSRYVSEPNERGIGIVRYPRLIPKDDATAERLSKRTLTNLYNERPRLDLAHRKLDAAVFAAYDWDSTASNEDILDRLLALNQERGR